METHFACWRTQLAFDQLRNALEQAAESHHELEANHFGGERDENWELWYAGVAWGSIPAMHQHLTPSKLAGLLIDVPAEFIERTDDWAEAAAWFVVNSTQGDSCLIGDDQ